MELPAQKSSVDQIRARFDAEDEAGCVALGEILAGVL